MNIIVEQTPLADHLGHAAWRAPVGLVKWQGMEPYWSLIVKFAYRYDSQAGTVALLNEPFDLQLAVPSTLPGANREDLAYASDFIFSKLGAEILLTGHAHSADGKEATPAGIRLVHGDEILCERSFRVVADSSSGRLPLSSGSLRELETDEPAGAVGPCTHTPPDTKNRPLEDVDFSAYCSGHPKQRVEFLPPDAALELFGLSATAAHFRLALPRLHPRAILETREYNHVGVELDCDTLWIDTDRELLVTVWRGLIPIASDDGSAFRRILLGIEDIDEPRTNEQARASLLHGPLSLAVTEESLRTPEAHAASGRAVLEAAGIHNILSKSF